MIIVICIVKVTRSQKPAPNQCAVCTGGLPILTHAMNTIITATSANANASGNHFSNHSERSSPVAASHDPTAFSCVFTRGIVSSSCCFLRIRLIKFRSDQVEEYCTYGL